MSDANEDTATATTMATVDVQPDIAPPAADSDSKAPLKHALEDTHDPGDSPSKKPRVEEATATIKVLSTPPNEVSDATSPAKVTSPRTPKPRIKEVYEVPLGRRWIKYVRPAPAPPKVNGTWRVLVAHHRAADGDLLENFLEIDTFLEIKHVGLREWLRERYPSCLKLHDYPPGVSCAPCCGADCRSICAS